MKDERNNERNEGKVREIKEKMKEKPEHLSIEKRKKKVNIILKKNKTTKKRQKRLT
jgi:hypothetical protein